MVLHCVTKEVHTCNSHVLDLLLVHSLAALLWVTLVIIVVHYASVEPRWEVEPVWIMWQSRVVTHDMGSYSLEKKRISMQGGDLTITSVGKRRIN